MNNRDFDNLFNNKLQGINESDFAFNDAAWEGVEGTLKKEAILPPKSRWRKLLPLFLILGFVISNGLLSWKYYSADKKATLLGQKIEVLETQLSQSKKELTAASEKRNLTSSAKEEVEELANESVVPSSTSSSPQIKIVEKIVYVPQIVYVNQNNDFSSALTNGSFSDKSQSILNNSIFSEPTLGNLPSNYGDTSSAGFYLSDKWVKSLDFIKVDGDDNVDVVLSDNLGTLDNTFENPLGIDSLDFLKNIKEAAAEADVFTNSFLQVKPLKPFETELDSLKNLEQMGEMTTNKNTLSDYLFVIGQGITPNGYEIGLTGTGNLGYTENYFNNIRVGVGITGGFRFSDNIRLAVGTTWNLSVYELDEIDGGDYSDDMFVDLPNLTPFSPDDRLNKVEGKLQFLEIPIEAEYIFGNTQNAWRPFIGGGVVARYHYKQVFEYYFLQSPDFLIDYNTGYQNRNFSEFGVNTWTAKAGMEYSINAHWLARGSLNYSNDFKVNGIDQRAFQQFGARLSILYRL